MPIFTEDILNKGKSRNGFWSNKQLYVLGLSEIKKGWKKKVLGTELSEEIIDNFLKLKDKHLKEKSIINPVSPPTLKQQTNPKENHTILSEEILEKGKSINGGWSIKQLQNFGISELKKGWKQKILNQEFPTEAINRFIALKNKHLEKHESTDRSISYDRLGVANLDIPIEEQYKNKSWIELKTKVLERDNYTCKICNKKYVELHVHHMTYSKGKFIWEIDSKFLLTVCKLCHEKIHDKELNTKT